mmetsp:Transcript_806/g.2924  ORF Transcript_806/g.2924 Transcript_806/m.2924 type:complete len:520 (-) Transcript_806:57-1616(-)
MWKAPLCLALLCLLASGAAAEKFFMMHVTDVHGWIDGHPHNETLDADFGDFASLVQHMNTIADEEDFEFLLFDSGDLVEGTGLSDATPIHGQYIFPIVAQIQNYTALTMGNHDVGYATTVQLMEQTFIPTYNDDKPQERGRYLTANVELAGPDHAFVGEPYTVYETKAGSRLLIIGWIFNFTQETPVTDITFVSDALMEPWFEAAMAEPDIDMIISVMHIDPQSTPELQQTYEAVRSYYPTIPYLMFSGHRHVSYFQWYDDTSFTIESGKYFEELGLVTFDLSDDGLFENFDYEWMPTSVSNFMELTNTTSDTFLTPLGQSIKAQIAHYTNVLSLNETLGCSPITYDPYIPTAIPTSLYNLYIEKMVPTMLYQNQTEDIPYFITNSATLRYDLYKGRVDVNDIFSVNPFADNYVYFQGLNGTQVQAIVQYSNSAVVPKPSRIVNFEELPYLHSMTRLDDSKIYNILCSDYDAYSIASWISTLYPSADNSYQPYPTSLSSTGVIGGYILQYMPCSDTCVC